ADRRPHHRLREAHVHDLPAAGEAAPRGRRGVRGDQLSAGPDPPRRAGAADRDDGDLRPRAPADARGGVPRARPRTGGPDGRRAARCDGRAPRARPAPDRRQGRPRGPRPAARAREGDSVDQPLRSADMSDERVSDGVVIRLITWAARPLSFYWTLAGIALCVAVVQTIRTGDIFWEAFGAAVTIAAVARLLAYVGRERLPSSRR